MVKMGPTFKPRYSFCPGPGAGPGPGPGLLLVVLAIFSVNFAMVTSTCELNEPHCNNSVNETVDGMVLTGTGKINDTVNSEKNHFSPPVPVISLSIEEKLRQVQNMSEENSKKIDFLLKTVFHPSAEHEHEGNDDGWFRNPILAEPGNPYTCGFLYRHTDNFYYMTFKDGPSPSTIDIYKNRILSNWASAEKATVYRVPPGFQSVASPKINFIRGNLYIYFSMMEDVGNEDDPTVRLTSRNYVIMAEDPENPLGNYTEEIRLSPFNPDEDRIAYQARAVQLPNNRLYLIYTGEFRGPEKKVSIYIAPLSSPTNISGPEVLVREPLEPWEIDAVEGAEVLQHGNVTNVVFMAFSNNDFTSCLGLMRLRSDQDPLVPGNWWHNRDGCVFYGDERRGISNIELGTFVTSPDFKENWILYRANTDKSNRVGPYTLRLDRVMWNIDGSPDFPRPSGNATAIPLPSGESKLLDKN